MASAGNAATLEMETLTTIPTFTPLSGPCATPEPDMLSQISGRSITIADTGKTYVAHVTSRFSIYLDDRVYPLQDLEKAVPSNFFGYISNGSIRGPQCYPIMYEALREGKTTITLKDFTLNVVIDDSLPMSTFPLH